MAFARRFLLGFSLILWTCIAGAADKQTAKVYISIVKPQPKSGFGGYRGYDDDGGGAPKVRYFATLEFDGTNDGKALLTLEPESVTDTTPEFLKTPVTLEHPGLPHVAAYLAKPDGWFMPMAEDSDRSHGNSVISRSNRPRHQPEFTRFQSFSRMGQFDLRKFGWSSGINNVLGPDPKRTDDLLVEIDTNGKLQTIRPVVVTQRITGTSRPGDLMAALGMYWGRAEAPPTPKFDIAKTYSGATQPDLLDQTAFPLDQLTRLYPAVGSVPYAIFRFSAPGFFEWSFDQAPLDIPLRLVGPIKDGKAQVLIQADVEQALLALLTTGDAPPPLGLVRGQRIPQTVRATMRDHMPDLPLGHPEVELPIYEIDAALLYFVTHEAFTDAGRRLRADYLTYASGGISFMERPKSPRAMPPPGADDFADDLDEEEDEAEAGTATKPADVQPEMEPYPTNLRAAMVGYAMIFLAGENGPKKQRFTLSDLIRQGAIHSDRVLECADFVGDKGQGGGAQ